MDLYGNQKKAILGSVLGLHQDIETRLAGQKIYPGDPLFAAVGDAQGAFLPALTAAKATVSALVSANVVAITINGISVAPVTYDTDAETTLNAVANAVNADGDIRDLGIEAYRVAGEPLTFYLSSAAVAITASGVITLGDSQGTVTVTAFTDKKFIGVARHSDSLSYREGAGFYPKGEEVNVVVHGQIAVNVVPGSDPAAYKPAYVITSGDDIGKFTADASGNYDTGAIFRSGEVEPGLAFLEVRGVK
jgi:hypothetical protein